MKPVDPQDTLTSAAGLSAPPPLEIECEAFTGSLAMLFQLAKQGRVDLLGIPLSPVCEAYFRYLVESGARDLDSAASALLALSYLVERKAWALIPGPEAEPSAEDDLEIPDPTVHEYTPVIEVLRIWQAEREKSFFRTSGGEGAFEMPYEMEDATPDDLARAFERLLRGAVAEPLEMLAGPRRSLAEQMRVVLGSLGDSFQPIDSIAVGPFTRTEAVWWFLALLELIRLGQARVKLVEGEARFARRREASS